MGALSVVFSRRKRRDESDVEEDFDK
jgi:hypothetical protein